MFLNAVYLSVIILMSPWLIWRSLRTGRYRRDLWPKLTGQVPVSSSPKYTVWFHGVSVGEIHLLRTLIAAYQKRNPDHRLVVSSTTDTGLAEAKKQFETVIAWPFDFTWAVSEAFDRVLPDLVVLAEGEMWPNFLEAAKRRNIPVVVVNARMSPRSFKRYCKVKPLAQRLMYDKVSVMAVQDEDYANRFRILGAKHVTVTGSIKYDGALKSPAGSKLSSLFRVKGLTVWVAGSTHAPEESVVLAAFARLKTEFPELRLILVPRHPDRFEEVNLLLGDSQLEYRRRSGINVPHEVMPAVVLLDTIGELGAAWSLADVGYVGGTLDGIRGGQSMIEPAGYGVPTVFGPHVWNFADAAKRLIEARGAVMIGKKEELIDAMREMIRDADHRQAMGERARDWVRSSAGATERTLAVLKQLEAASAVRRAA